MARKPDTRRTCAVTRQERDIADLIRFAVSPDDEIVPDVDARAPGRGVWITLSEAVVDEAVKRKAFARSLKAQVKVPPDLALQARSRLEQRLLGALGLARKAGILVTGAAKVAATLEAGRAAALLTATDGAPDGRRKILQSARRGAALVAERGADIDQAGERPAAGLSIPHFELIGSDRLGLALGLESVIHAALLSGAASNSAIERAQRLARYVATAREEDSTL